MRDPLSHLFVLLSFVLIMTKKALKRTQRKDVEKEDKPNKKMSDEPAAKKVSK